MKKEALFLNGVYESVLKEILLIQEQLPEQILFLQPYSASPIIRLREDPPSVEDPMLLLISVTSGLPDVAYAAEIVGWDDKKKLDENVKRFNVLSRLVWTLQPQEGGLYDLARSGEGKSLNLLHIRRLTPLGSAGFKVSELVKSVDGTPVSDQRATAGGWVYIRSEGLLDRIGWRWRPVATE